MPNASLRIFFSHYAHLRCTARLIFSFFICRIGLMCQIANCWSFKWVNISFMYFWRRFFKWFPNVERRIFQWKQVFCIIVPARNIQIIKKMGLVLILMGILLNSLNKKTWQLLNVLLLNNPHIFYNFNSETLSVH